MKKFFALVALLLMLTPAFSLSKKEIKILRDGDIGTFIEDSCQIGRVLIFTIYTKLGKCILVQTYSNDDIEVYSVSFENFFGDDYEK